jgi:hypothetical protein
MRMQEHCPALGTAVQSDGEAVPLFAVWLYVGLLKWEVALVGSGASVESEALLVLWLLVVAAAAAIGR